MSTSRLRLRFSLRTLFVVMTLLGTLGWYITRCEMQRRAIAEIERAGGSVDFEDESRIDTSFHPTGPTLTTRAKRYFLTSPKSVAYMALPKEGGLQVLKSLPGLDMVVIHNIPWHPPEQQARPVTNDDLRSLASCSQLREITLGNCRGGDDVGVNYLSGMRSLNTLCLQDSSIGDKGLRQLARLPQLQELVLSGSKITDDGLSALRGKPLVLLNVANTGITDRGMQELLQARPDFHFKWLCLQGTKITNETLSLLADQRELTLLNLADTMITDEGVARLAEHPNLEELYLDNTAMSDASLSIFETMPKLREISGDSIAGTDLTDEGKRRLSRWLSR